MSSRIAILGLATLDYVLETDVPIEGTGTVSATVHIEGGWPRAGGAPLFAAHPMAESGLQPLPIVSVGNDANGLAYRRACELLAIDQDGIATIDGGKTPCCILIYHNDGRYTCLLDAGSALSSDLTPSQRNVISSSDLVMISATHTSLIRATLGSLTAHQQSAWIVKDDLVCHPEDIRRELVRRADYIFCNRSERHLIEPFADLAKPTTVLFETRGAAGVEISQGADRIVIPAEPVEVDDATGAGDTFAGAAMAAILASSASPSEAALIGIAGVRRMLLERTRTRE